MTGATGFLGRRIAVHAAARGWKVRALVRGDRRQPIPGVHEVVGGDLADRAALARLVEGAALIIHNAGRVRARSAAAFFAVNHVGAAAVAAAAAQGAPDAAFVLISSLAARRPEISPYAASKAAGEAAVRAALVGRKLAILRPPAIYGPFDAATKPLFDAIRLGVAPRLGPAAARFAMIYVDDAAGAALAAAEAAMLDVAIFEIDDGAGGHRWADVRAAATAAAGRRLLLLPVAPIVIRALGVAGSIAARLGLGTPFLTAGKAREILAGDWLVDPVCALPNWSPEVSLYSGFSQTLACYRKRSRTNR